MKFRAPAADRRVDEGVSMQEVTPAMVRTAATDPWVGVAALVVMATLWFGITLLRQIRGRYDRVLVGIVGLIATFQGLRCAVNPHGWVGLANAIGVVLCLIAMGMLSGLVRNRRQAELALRLSEARERPMSTTACVEMTMYSRTPAKPLDVSRTILDSAPMPMFSVGLDGSVNFWNTAAERVLGWRKDEVLGHRMPNLVAHSSIAPVNGQFDGSPIFLVGKNGAPVSGPVQSVPVRDSNGIVSGILTIVSRA